MSYPSASDRLETLGWRWLLVALIAAWLVYSVNGFRLPWSPILVSDADSGAKLRQLLFSATGGVAFIRLFVSGAFGPVLIRHPGLVGVGVGLLSTTVYSADPVLTVKRSIIFLFGILTLVVATHSFRRPVRLMQVVLVGVTGVAAWISVFGWFAFPSDAVSIAERPGLAGVSGHPNTLAPAMVVGFLLSLGVTVESGRSRLLLRTLQSGLLVALVLTDSITSYVFMIVGLLVFLMLTVSSYRRGVVQLTLAITFALVMFIGPSSIKSGAFNVAGRDPSLSGRSSLWQEVWAFGMDAPVFGSGFGAFWYEGRGREIVGTWNPRQSHHAYVDVFVDLGVVD